MNKAQQNAAHLVGGRRTQNKMRNDVQSALDKMAVAQYLLLEGHAAQRLDLSGRVHE